METKTYTTIDRTAAGWSAGPWDDEPDKIQWLDAETGLPCLAVRNSVLGFWCGYVGVPPMHPSYGKNYNELDMDFDVHGGLTYSDKCQPDEDESQSICHTPAPGEADHVWWFGFDCAHCNDYLPIYKFGCTGNYIYRTLTYVQQQCAILAMQLAQAAITKFKHD